MRKRKGGQSRKEKRKRKRVEKKSKKHASFLARHKAGPLAEEGGSENVGKVSPGPKNNSKVARKVQRTQPEYFLEDPDDREIAYLEKRLGLKKSSGESNGSKLRKELTQEDGFDEEFLEWLDRAPKSLSADAGETVDTPAQKSTVWTRNVDDEHSRAPRHKELSPEDEEIQYLEKKLGMHKGTGAGKLEKELKGEDGFDEEFVDWMTRSSSVGNHGAEESVEIVPQIVQAGNELSSETDGDSDDSADGDRFLYNAAPSADDIYGQIKVVAGQSTDGTPGDKYIPPHLRGRKKSAGSVSKPLERQVQGLLNRLVIENIETVSTSMCELYEENSVAAVNEVLVSAVVACAKDQLNPLPFSALIIALSVSVHGGINTLSAFVERVTDDIVLSMSQTGMDYKKDESMFLYVLISQLYLLDGVACTLVADIVARLAKSMSTVNVYRLLSILGSCGRNLRKKSPGTISLVFDNAQELVGNSSDDTQSQQRICVQALFDRIIALKNNRDAPSASEVENVSRVKKWLSSYKKKTHGEQIPTLRLNLKDIVDREKSGRWWIVGASWKKDTDGESGRPEQFGTKATGSSKAVGRKEVFGAIMGGHDVEDSLNKVLKLKFKSKVQERTIMLTVIDCNCRGKQYNPFFALLGARLCQVNPDHKFTLKVQYWDFWKSCEEKSIRVISNSAKFFAHMIANFVLSFAVCKVLSWKSMDEKLKIFFNVVFETLLRNCDNATLFSIFDRITSNREDHQSVKSGLKHRFKYFVMDNKRSVRMQEEKVGIVLKGLNKGISGL
eukprot:g4730.t1